MSPLRSPRAFTILELLVAVSVMALLVLLVAQLVQSGTAVIAGSRKNLGADAQAREVFNRFAIDSAQMVRRRDADAIFSAQDGNKKIFFYSEGPGFASSTTNASTVSLVGYRISTNAGIERLGKGLAWDGTDAPIFLTYTNAAASNALPASTLAGAWAPVVGADPAYDGADPAYHPLADGVFRMDYCFQKADGTYSLTRDPAAGFRDVSAIILTLAILDGDSRKIASDVSQLASALPSPTAADLAANRLAGEIWQARVNAAATFAASAGIPVAAASRVRIYQRAFPLSTR